MACRRVPPRLRRQAVSSIGRWATRTSENRIDWHDFNGRSDNGEQRGGSTSIRQSSGHSRRGRPAPWSPRTSGPVLSFPRRAACRVSSSRTRCRRAGRSDTRSDPCTTVRRLGHMHTRIPANMPAFASFFHPTAICRRAHTPWSRHTGRSRRRRLRLLEARTERTGCESVENGGARVFSLAWWNARSKVESQSGTEATDEAAAVIALSGLAARSPRHR